MGNVSGTNKSSKSITSWLCSRFQNSSETFQKSANSESVYQPSKKPDIRHCSIRDATKKSNNQGLTNYYSWLLQSNLSCSKAKQQMETSNRSQCFKSHVECTNFQDGNSGIDQKVDQTRRMGHIDGHNRRLFSCAHSSEIAKISEISDKQGSFSVSGSPFRGHYSTSRIHTNRQRGEVNGNAKRYLHSPVPRRLVTESQYSRSMSRKNKTTTTSSSTTRLAHQLQKIRAGTHPKFRFSGLPLQPSRCSRFSDSEKARSDKNTDCFHQKVFLCDSKEDNVLYRDISFSGEDGTNGQTTYEAISVVPQDPLAVSSVIRQTNSNDSDTAKTSCMVGRSSNSHERISSTSFRTKHPFVHRRVKRMGSPLKRVRAQLSLVTPRNKAPHKRFGAKSCSFSSKRFSGALTTAEHTDLFRQFNCSGIHQQTRRHSLSRDVCPDLGGSGFHQSKTNPDQSHVPGSLNVIADALSRRDKVIHTEWSLHRYILKSS